MGAQFNIILTGKQEIVFLMWAAAAISLELWMPGYD